MYDFRCLDLSSLLINTRFKHFEYVFLLLGIQDSFCQVARELIEVYETVPNHGMHVVDSYGSSPTKGDNINVSIQRRRSSVAQSTGQTTKSGCC